MEQKRILLISDMDFSGSGYFNIATPICVGLSSYGYDLKVLGLSYKGEQHHYPFPIIPMRGLQDVEVAINNMAVLWKPDLIIMAMDIPIQEQMFAKIRHLGIKYMAICPLENGPLMMSWSMILSQMDKVFFISQLGTDEAKKAGVSKAEHLVIGIDPKIWRKPTDEERMNIRHQMGFTDDEKVVLTVADNQERKNLWAGMEIVRRARDGNPNMKFKYVLATRIHNPYGSRLQELANLVGIGAEYLEFERGMPQRDLWLLYACADAFLIPSKAEGLCMPALEAMAVGVPVVGTDTGAIHELLSDGRGYLVPPAYEFIDVWGNSKRSMIDVNEGAVLLTAAATTGRIMTSKKALDYVQSRTWSNTVLQVKNSIEEMLNVTQPSQQE